MSDPELVIMGPPGAGKGTQSTRLVERYDIDHVTTGDALRANKDMQTEYGTPRSFMEKGELVPDAVVNEIVSEALADAEGFVLDGYPRNLSQAEFLADVDGVDVDAVVYLDVSEDVLLSRLTGRRVCEDCGTNYHVDFDPPAEEGVCDGCGGTLVQREDDTEDVAGERVRVYREETAPVVEHYESTGDLVRVDGERPPDEVWSELKATVDAVTGD